jgi:hypothetical protein
MLATRTRLFLFRDSGATHVQLLQVPLYDAKTRADRTDNLVWVAGGFLAILRATALALVMAI